MVWGSGQMGELLTRRGRRRQYPRSQNDLKSKKSIPQNIILYHFQHLEQALLLGTRGAFIHECKELGLTTGNNNGKRRSSVSSASGVFDKLKVNVFQAFDDVDMETFFEVCLF